MILLYFLIGCQEKGSSSGGEKVVDGIDKSGKYRSAKSKNIPYGAICYKNSGNEDVESYSKIINGAVWEFNVDGNNVLEILKDADCEIKLKYKVVVKEEVGQVTDYVVESNPSPCEVDVYFRDLKFTNTVKFNYSTNQHVPDVNVGLIHNENVFAYYSEDLSYGHNRTCYFVFEKYE